MDMKQILSVWENKLETDNKLKIKQLIRDELTFFFKLEDEYYGCPEDSRLIFAKLKIPDEDYVPSWDEDAAFIAFNITRGIKEDNIPKRLFYKKDIKKMKVVDPNEIEKILK